MGRWWVRYSERISSNGPKSLLHRNLSCDLVRYKWKWSINVSAGGWWVRSEIPLCLSVLDYFILKHRGHKIVENDQIHSQFGKVLSFHKNCGNVASKPRLNWLCPQFCIASKFKPTCPFGQPSTPTFTALLYTWSQAWAQVQSLTIQLLGTPSWCERLWVNVMFCCLQA